MQSFVGQLDWHTGVFLQIYSTNQVLRVGFMTGVVPIAHNSGGPKADIVSTSASSSQPSGFLCTTAQEYADALTVVLCMEAQEREAYVAAGRR